MTKLIASNNNNRRQVRKVRFVEVWGGERSRVCVYAVLPNSARQPWHRAPLCLPSLIWSPAPSANFSVARQTESLCLEVWGFVFRLLFWLTNDECRSHTHLTPSHYRPLLWVHFPAIYTGQFHWLFVNEQFTHLIKSSFWRTAAVRKIFEIALFFTDCSLFRYTCFGTDCCWFRHTYFS